MSATDPTAEEVFAAIGAKTETAPGTDTASSGLNGRLQRIAQRLTSLIALLPSALGGNGGLKVDPAGTFTVDTELPAAATLADDSAFPSAPTLYAVLAGKNRTSGLVRRLQTWNTADAPASGLEALLTASIALVHTGSGTAWFERVADTFKNLTTVAITAATPATVWTPVAGKKPRVLKGQFSMSVAGQLILLDSATEILRSPNLAAGATWDFDLGKLGKIAALADNLIKIDVSTNASVGGWVGGTEE